MLRDGIAQGEGIDVSDRVPVFHADSYDAHVQAWRAAYALKQREWWQLAAIAASLARSFGGRPGRQVGRQLTVVQRFCRDVRIDRQTFHRLCRTYRIFAETSTTGGTSFIGVLSFKHHEVAARLAKEDPAAAVAQAHEKKWTANELERQLQHNPKRKAFSIPRAVSRLQQTLMREISSWPENEQTPETIQMIVEAACKHAVEKLAARKVSPLTYPELHALRWIKADLENFPFTPHTFNEIPVGRGAGFQVVGGAAGAPIYQAIIADGPRNSRQDVLTAVNLVIAGKVTALGRRVLQVARDLADGRLSGLMMLPADAGGDLRGTLYDDLPPCLSELEASEYDDPIGRREEQEMIVASA